MSLMRSELRLYLYAVQFLTRIPVPSWVGHQASDLNACVRYFPWVGASVGLIAGAVFWLAHLVLPGFVAASLAVACAILLTGGFHEDGLADSWDGLGGGVTKARALEIMRDSRVGTYGALALGLSLIIRIGALASLPPALGWVALIVTHASARMIIPSILRFFTYARAEGLAKPVADDIARHIWIFAVISGLAFASFLGLYGLLACLMAHLAGWVMIGLFQRKLGGYTGDGLGAVEQVGEMAALITLAAVI
ncbi:adenosylcobinamide-GDP ribazoletransferase [Woodsholea maritima]|uniref:adenosylcobinamide-GDP ribazoletransferase n=1 Tax=Woodsholea maritima TaxID=240237 RepID=UPI000371D6A2|nr:adenosylcobinamide-GDP ribazoletransferase [Woodsholea maritima]